ncbi:MAG: endonuclease MutS2 [Oscillatoria sp. SIO1A7]|nr:endonuclease MutS2 [Oscillatoria sp. SIO1A7]
MRSLRDRVYQILQGILQKQGNAIQQQLITQRGDRFVIPVKAPQKDAIPGIVHDASTTGATLYIEPNAIVGFNNQLRVLLRQEKTEEETILRALTAGVAAVAEDLERLLAIATILDLAVARSRYSFWLGGNAPQFWQRSTEQTEEPAEGEEESGEKSGEEEPGEKDSLERTQEGAGEKNRKKEANKNNSSNSRITLRQLRHPLLVWQQQHEQGPVVVPIDLGIQPHIKIVAITGPNTGGKTVALKTLGLAVLMAKAGLFVPAREPVELPWFDLVLADIGDEQSLEQSLSTFSGHIRRIGRILDAMTLDSLVLLDEVGAGTDPTEGSALAIALLQHLAARAGLTMATTHYGELKALKYQDDRFENAAVEFDDASLSPTYRLLWGIPGRSNALAIASRLGLKPEIIEEARTRVGPTGSEDINRTIAALEMQRRQQEIKAEEAAKLLQSTEELNREVSKAAESLEQRERLLRLQQERAVQEAIAEAKAEIARAIRQLQSGNPTGKDAAEATKKINAIAKEYLPSYSRPPKPKPGYRPKEGDRVRIPSLGQTAEVLEVVEENAEVTVRFGLMKMTVSLAEIESLDGLKPEQAVKSKPLAGGRKETQAEKAAPAAPPPTVRTSRNTLDLRGKRVADGEIELEQAIATQIPTGGALWIIHGKGTGKLREGVSAFLAQHPHISHYELAKSQDGGSGVTIAYLK